MPRTAAARMLPGAAPTKPKQVYGLAAQGKRRKEMDDLGPIVRVTHRDIITLRDLCASEGSVKVAEQVGLAEVTLLRVMAGLGERCLSKSLETLRTFLTKLNS
jgi:hypothetical protein